MEQQPRQVFLSSFSRVTEPRRSLVGGPPEPAEIYQAFVSYSHAADGQLAPAIQRGLHRLAKPWYRRPRIRVFRDDTSLAVTPTLWSTIEQALARSRFLILLASPDAAQSPWVDREVAWWLEHRSPERLLVVLTEGELVWDSVKVDFGIATTALPPSLEGALPEEPLWLDLRWARSGDDVSLSHPRFRDNIAALAAPLHGKTKEELVGEDLLQQRRFGRWRNLAIAAVSIFAVFSAIGALVAVDQMHTARRERDQADSRRLASQAVSMIDRQDDLAQLLSLESLRTATTGEAWRSIQATLSQPLHRSRQLAGHSGAVTGVAFSPDGQLLATAGADKALRLWNVDTYEPVGDPFQHDAALTSVGFRPDNLLVAAGTAEGAIVLWDPRTGASARAPIAAHSGRVTAIRFSGVLLASAGGDHTVRLWDSYTGRPLLTLTGHSGEVTSLAFTRDGQILASGDAVGEIRLWRPADGTLIGTLSGHIRDVSALAFSPDGKQLISGSHDGTVKVWDPTRLHQIDEVPFHDDAANAVDFSPSGDSFATAGMDRVVRLWDPSSFAALLREFSFSEDRSAASPPITGHGDQINSIIFSPDGRLIATGSDDTTARIWVVAPRQPIGHPLEGHESNVSNAVFSPDNRWLASSSNDTTIRIWSMPDGSAVQTLTGHTKHIEGLAVNGDGTLIGSGSQDRTVRLWDAASGHQLGEPMIGHEDTVTAVAFVPSSSTLVSASADGTVRRWNVKTGEPIGPPMVHGGLLFGLAISPDGGLIASSGEDGQVRFWNTETGDPSGDPLPHPEATLGVAFSPDGKLVATASFDGNVRIFSVESRRLVGRPLSATSDVIDVSFSPDGRFLASANFDGTVGLWLVADQSSFADPIDVDTDALNAVSFSPDGRFLVAAGVQSLQLLATPSQWISESCAIVGRNMSQQEWNQYSRGRYVRHCSQYPSGLGAPGNAPVARYPAP